MAASAFDARGLSSATGGPPLPMALVRPKAMAGGSGLQPAGGGDRPPGDAPPSDAALPGRLAPRTEPFVWDAREAAAAGAAHRAALAEAKLKEGMAGGKPSDAQPRLHAPVPAPPARKTVLTRRRRPAAPANRGSLAPLGSGTQQRPRPGRRGQETASGTELLTRDEVVQRHKRWQQRVGTVSRESGSSGLRTLPETPQPAGEAAGIGRDGRAFGVSVPGDGAGARDSVAISPVRPSFLASTPSKRPPMPRDVGGVDVGALRAADSGVSLYSGPTAASSDLASPVDTPTTRRQAEEDALERAKERAELNDEAERRRALADDSLPPGSAGSYVTAGGDTVATAAREAAQSADLRRRALAGRQQPRSRGYAENGGLSVAVAMRDFGTAERALHTEVWRRHTKGKGNPHSLRFSTLQLGATAELIRRQHGMQIPDVLPPGAMSPTTAHTDATGASAELWLDETLDTASSRKTSVLSRLRLGVQQPTAALALVRAGVIAGVPQEGADGDPQATTDLVSVDGNLSAGLDGNVGDTELVQRLRRAARRAEKVAREGGASLIDASGDGILVSGDGRTRADVDAVTHPLPPASSPPSTPTERSESRRSGSRGGSGRDVLVSRSRDIGLVASAGDDGVLVVPSSRGSMTPRGASRGASRGSTAGKPSSRSGRPASRSMSPSAPGSRRVPSPRPSKALTGLRRLGIDRDTLIRLGASRKLCDRLYRTMLNSATRMHDVVNAVADAIVRDPASLKSIDEGSTADRIVTMRDNQSDGDAGAAKRRREAAKRATTAVWVAFSAVLETYAGDSKHSASGDDNVPSSVTAVGEIARIVKQRDDAISEWFAQFMERAVAARLESKQWADHMKAELEAALLREQRAKGRYQETLGEVASREEAALRAERAVDAARSETLTERAIAAELGEELRMEQRRADRLELQRNEMELRMETAKMEASHAKERLRQALATKNRLQEVVFSGGGTESDAAWKEMRDAQESEGDMRTKLLDTQRQLSEALAKTRQAEEAAEAARAALRDRIRDEQRRGATGHGAMLAPTDPVAGVEAHRKFHASLAHATVAEQRLRRKADEASKQAADLNEKVLKLQKELREERRARAQAEEAARIASEDAMAAEEQARRNLESRESEVGEMVDIDQLIAGEDNPDGHSTPDAADARSTGATSATSRRRADGSRAGSAASWRSPATARKSRRQLRMALAEAEQKVTRLETRLRALYTSQVEATRQSSAAAIEVNTLKSTLAAQQLARGREAEALADLKRRYDHKAALLERCQEQYEELQKSSSARIARLADEVETTSTLAESAMRQADAMRESQREYAARVLKAQADRDSIIARKENEVEVLRAKLLAATQRDSPRAGGGRELNRSDSARSGLAGDIATAARFRLLLSQMTMMHESVADLVKLFDELDGETRSRRTTSEHVVMPRKPQAARDMSRAAARMNAKAESKQEREASPGAASSRAAISPQSATSSPRTIARIESSAALSVKTGAVGRRRSITRADSPGLPLDFTSHSEMVSYTAELFDKLKERLQAMHEAHTHRKAYAVAKTKLVQAEARAAMLQEKLDAQAAQHQRARDSMIWSAITGRDGEIGRAHV